MHGEADQSQVGKMGKPTGFACSSVGSCVGAACVWQRTTEEARSACQPGSVSKDGITSLRVLPAMSLSHNNYLPGKSGFKYNSWHQREIRASKNRFSARLELHLVNVSVFSQRSGTHKQDLLNCRLIYFPMTLKFITRSTNSFQFWTK